MTNEDPRGVAAVFDPRRLALARQARGLRKNDVAALVGVTPAAVSQFELGGARPSPATLAKLSLGLQFPTSFFARGRPYGDSHGQLPHFRSLRSTSQVERSRALALCELAWELADTLGRRVQLPLLRLPAYPVTANATTREVEAVAAQVRRDIGLQPGPVGNVVRLLESRGVIVVRLEDGVADVDAFCQVFNERPVVCLYGNKRDGARSRHDAAHELGHLVMHADAEPGGRLMEQQAHAFAAALLTPAEQIAPLLSSRVRFDELVDLKAAWGVSMRSLVYRSRALGVISESAYRRAMVTLKSQWRDCEPGDVDPEQPCLFERGIDVVNKSGGSYSIERLAVEARVPIDLACALAGVSRGAPVLSLESHERSAFGA